MAWRGGAAVVSQFCGAVGWRSRMAQLRGAVTWNQLRGATNAAPPVSPARKTFELYKIRGVRRKPPAAGTPDCPAQSVGCGRLAPRSRGPRQRSSAKGPAGGGY